ncbi:acyl-CoA-binding domain-containing protein 5-B-like isoform X2 [Phycodurus eques]|uniref:acyl-CoA-binding domain-containing protein 5-B-like isoform X2 n=1 Tax=Phycodurus eques TaxID=693459 RepID=UPI002ACE248D|nr:acyl-CoA-binding domain-containing protein 5-B-like isoform X2 [Phycodurus eques]
MPRSRTRSILTQSRFAWAHEITGRSTSVYVTKWAADLSRTATRTGPPSQSTCNLTTVADDVHEHARRTLALSSTVTMAPDGEDRQTLRAKFAAAVQVIRSLPKQGPFQLSDDMMLMFSSYYKQATVGPCTFTRPTGFWESREKNKWDAWSSLGNMTKEEAMKNYVEHIQPILETMPISSEVSDLVRQLGDFIMEEEEDEEEDGAEENELDRRAFAAQAELFKPKKPAMEGYGDLWDDIQNFQEEESGTSFSRQEAVGCDGGREHLRKNESSDDDEDEPDGKERSPGSRRHTAQDTGWRRYAGGSSGSSEPGVSSLTNGTHSSLNSAAEEEELAYSKELSTCSPVCKHFHGHLTDHTDAGKKSCHLADSDNEEFCDSMDHPAIEKPGGSTPALVKEQDLWFESSSTLKAEDCSLRGDSYHREPHKFVRDCQSPKTAGSSQQRFCTCNSVSQCTRPSSKASWGNVNEQIVAALVRLQDDMADVLRRLRALEGLTAAQSRSSSRCADAPPAAQKFLTPSWWPFDRSPITVAVTALWPAVAYGLVQLFSQRKRRKIT